MSKLETHHGSKRRLLAALSCLVLLATLFGAWRVRENARGQLALEREAQARRDEIPFEKNARAPLRRRDITFRQSTAASRDIARFGDSYFIATDGGLLERSTLGKLLRHYTVLDGLPESDLTCLAVFKSKLYIGTRTKGLVRFDGENFESFRWTDRDAQAVTALREDGAHLLVGTFNGGLISFDGARFTELKAGGAERQRLLQITFIEREATRLYAGTFNDGLWIEEAGRWRHFTSADGLGSNRIVGVTEREGDLFVASDFALAFAPGDSSSLFAESTGAGQTVFQTLATWPTLASLVRQGEEVLACLDDGELRALSPATTPRAGSTARASDVSWEKPPDLSECRLRVVDGNVWLLSNRGVMRAVKREGAELAMESRQLSLMRFGETEPSPELSSNAVSALALDADGKLWAGSFRNGLDIFTPEGKRHAHVSTEAAREINALVPDAKSKAMLVATSGGLLRFDSTLRSQRLTTADGLLSNSITHAAFVRTSLANPNEGHSRAAARPETLYLATSRGLSVSEGGRWRGLTTVQGLPGNSIYAVLTGEQSTYVGTLGGLAQIESGRVARVFNDTNSNLTHNWVTAICRAGERLFIGTYGGGVFELMPSGELRGFTRETGRQFVNPNAMCWDGERLLVGTLDGAWTLNVRSQKWTHLQDELPSSVVLSIACDERQTYFGTTAGLARIEPSFWNESHE